MTRPQNRLSLLRTLSLALIVIALTIAARVAQAKDMLIMADGVKTGAVEGYADGNCSFDGATVPRASIYFIGLDAELPVPTPQDYMRDEVHLRDGSVHPGPLVSIDANNVVTDSASHARKDVAWIWLTPMLGGHGQAAPSTTAEEDVEQEQRPSYEWAGIIKVENRYSGRVGRPASMAGRVPGQTARGSDQFQQAGSLPEHRLVFHQQSGTGGSRVRDHG